MHNVGRQHRGTDILMPEQFLDCSTLTALLKHMSRKGVAKRMAACRLGYPGFSDDFFYNGFSAASMTAMGRQHHE
jgi:hypothetical protein